MIKKSIKLIALITLVFLYSGCSAKIFLPYEEEPLCKKGYGAGYCGSVSEVYNITIDQR